VILASSGTTGRPKIIPLSHRNVLATCAALTERLHLSSGDRTLAVVPPWFGQGLSSTLAVTMYSGGSVICAPGLDVSRIADWLIRLQPTWYPAGSSSQARILNALGGAIDRHRLRFIRTAGESLPVGTREDLEAHFGVPLIEAYGLTEALGVTINPLPPGRRKP